MLARLPTTWAVYRRTPDGFERIAVVSAHYEGQAAAAAARLPDGPRHPIVARSHTGQREPVDFAQFPIATSAARRTRRHYDARL